MKRSTSLLSITLVGSLLLAGCGGGGSSQTTPPTQSPQQIQITGPWQVSATRCGNSPCGQNGVPTGGIFLEFNANQTGSTFSASQVAIMDITFMSGSPGDYTRATWSPQNCVPGPYSLTGTIDNASSTVKFTVEETGGQITATSTMGTGSQAGVLKGTYNDPPCNVSNLSFVATQALTLAGKYANTCNFNPCGTADPSLTVQVAQDSSNHLTINGNDTKDGNFTLSGTAIGSSMWVSGMISGQNVSWYGSHYEALDKNLQEIFIIDAATNSPVATVEGCVSSQPCTPQPL